MLSGARKRDLRPYNLRIVRDHGGGLWTMEADDGQLYLSVLAKSVDDFKRERLEHERATGGIYARAARARPPQPRSPAA
jgi:hypothetical protein